MAMAEYPLTTRGDRRLGPRRTKLILDYIRQRLELRHRIETERISRWQVTDEHGRPGGSLVGVARDGDRACIFHTRALTLEDIVHELLHVRHPDWPEDEVNRVTAAIVGELVQGN